MKKLASLAFIFLCAGCAAIIPGVDHVTSNQILIIDETSTVGDQITLEQIDVVYDFVLKYHNVEEYVTPPLLLIVNDVRRCTKYNKLGQCRGWDDPGGLYNWESHHIEVEAEALKTYGMCYFLGLLAHEFQHAILFEVYKHKNHSFPFTTTVEREIENSCYEG